MSEFLKYTGSTKFYCMCSAGVSGLLSTGMTYPNTNAKLLYFGLTDGTNFKNNLKGINDKPILLTCDLSGCDASVYHYLDNVDNDTAMNINIKIPSNSNTRYIKFSYNNLLVFSIRLIQKITYIYTYKFNKIDGQGPLQGNFDDYAYKYDLFLSYYLKFVGGRSDYMNISNKSIKITDLLFYYTSNNIDGENVRISGLGTIFSGIKSAIGSYGWFYPETVTNDGYTCHMQSYSTLLNEIIYLNEYNTMPSVLYVLAVKDDTSNYIMGFLQKTDEIIYSYVS